MKPKSLSNLAQRGITMLEALIVLAVCLLVIAAMLLPTLARSRASSSKINCTYNQ
jgi:Tfp pilus assembly protein PilV